MAFKPGLVTGDDDRYMTSLEHAEYRRTTRGVLAQERHHGRGPKYIKLSSKQVLYRKSDIDAWLQAHLVDPEGDA